MGHPVDTTTKSALIPNKRYGENSMTEMHTSILQRLVQVVRSDMLIDSPLYTLYPTAENQKPLT